MNQSPLPSADEPSLIPRVRTLIGFLIAPIVAALAFALTPVGPGSSQPVPFAIEFCIQLGYPVAFVLGVPTYLFFLWRRWDGWSVYLAAGAVLSIVAICWDTAQRGADFSRLLEELTNIPLLSQLIAGGMTGALCFWLIARPDRVE